MTHLIHAELAKLRTTRTTPMLLAAQGADVEFTGPDELVAGGVTSEQVGRAAAAANIAIYEMRLEQPDLEKAFLQLTAPQGGRS